MIWVFRQLLVPCNYLRIRQGDTLLQSKAVYDFVLPVVLTIITASVFVVLNQPLTIFGKTSLFNSTSSLLAILIGFYMAALAAVSTFHREGIDQGLKGGDAILYVRHHDGGRKVPKKLSYRQYISYLFGYASFLSFVIYTTLLVLSGTWPRIKVVAKDYIFWDWAVAHLFEPAVFSSVFFALWQLFITSLVGIYFLAERIQSLNDPEN